MYKATYAGLSRTWCFYNGNIRTLHKGFIVELPLCVLMSLYQGHCTTVRKQVSQIVQGLLHIFVLMNRGHKPTSFIDTKSTLRENSREYQTKITC